MQYWGLWLLIHLGRRLPLRVLYWLAIGAGNLGWWLSPALRRGLRQRVGRAMPEAATEAQRRHAARRAAQSLALYYADFVRGAGRGADRGAESLDELVGGDGIHHLFDAIDSGRGVIILSAHLGNPEFLMRPLGAMGLPIFAFTERLEPPRVHDLVHRTRAAPNVHYEPLGVRAVRGALAHLRCGGIVAVLSDRDVTGNAPLVPFFGAPAPLPQGAVDLALRSGAAIIPAFLLRVGPGRYHATVLPEIELDRQADRATATAAGVAATARALETGIALDPGQWFGAAHPIWPEPPAPYKK